MRRRSTIPTAPAPPSRPRRVRRGLLAGMASVVWLGACATEVPTERQLADALFDSGIPRSLADCAADAVVGSLSESELRLLVERGAGAAPEGESAERVRTALAACQTAETEAEVEAGEAQPGG